MFRKFIHFPFFSKVGSVVPPEPIDEIPVRNFGRHVVLKVVPRGPNEVELTLWSDLLEIERTCILKGFWFVVVIFLFYCLLFARLFVVAVVN